MIKERLGYLPPEYVTIRFEPFIRGLLHLYNNQQIEFDDFLCQTDEHIKLIRNEDIRRRTTLNYDQSIYDRYTAFLPEYIEPAKQRITKLLGYKPHFDYSAEPEMFIRLVLKQNISEQTINQERFSVITVKYRETFTEHGILAANRSCLISFR